MNSRPEKRGDSYRLRWWDADGNRRCETVHTDFKSACLLLRQRENEAEEIRRGLRAPAIEPKTFGQLADYYLKFYSSEKRNARADTTNINTNLRPHFGGLKLHEIGEEHLSEYRLKKRALSPKTLHTHLTLLGTMLRVAQDNNWLLKLPKIKKPKIILLDRNFRFLRTDEEIRRLLLAARQEESEIPFYFLSWQTFQGTRAGEAAGLEWADIDFERNLVTIRRSYDGPTKNGETRIIPLFKIMRPLMREWRLKNPGRLVFPNQHGTMLGESSRLFQEVFHRVLDRADFPKRVFKGQFRRYIVLHDLRHTMASHFMMRGGDIFRLQKILGHRSISQTMRYSHLSPHAFEGDLDRFAGISLEPQGPGDVVRLDHPSETQYELRSLSPAN